MANRQHISVRPEEILFPWGPWVLALLYLCCAANAQAFTFTPYVTLEGGYDDNIRLRRDPVGDFFFSVTPGFQLEAGEPASLFSANASVRYTRYYSHEDLSNFDGGQVTVSYKREPTRNWAWEVWDSYSFSYDPPILDEEGNVVAVEDTDGRRDSNTVGVRTSYAYNVGSSVGASYAYTTSSYTELDDEDSDNHRFMFFWNHRYNEDWAHGLSLYYFRSLFSDSNEDIDRVGGDLTVTRMMGPTTSAWVRVGFYDVRSLSDDALIQRERQYRRYSGSAGFDHQISPAFAWGFSVGWAYVDGDTGFSSTSDRGSPIATFYAKYTGQRWRMGVVASTDLGAYTVLDEERGLARTHTVSVYYGYDFTPRLTFDLSAYWVRNDYDENPVFIPNTTDQDNEAVVVSMGLGYQLTRWSTIAFRYRYLERFAINEEDERTQNRIFVILTLRQPYRW